MIVTDNEKSTAVCVCRCFFSLLHSSYRTYKVGKERQNTSQGDIHTSVSVTYTCSLVANGDSLYVTGFAARYTYFDIDTGGFVLESPAQ